MNITIITIDNVIKSVTTEAGMMVMAFIPDENLLAPASLMVINTNPLPLKHLGVGTLVYEQYGQPVARRVIMHSTGRTTETIWRFHPAP